MALNYATSTIVSDAFRQMELDPISSFGDATEQASAAAEQYPEAMKQCLEAVDWSFASKFENLPEAANLPVDADLPHNFVRPADLLRLIEVQPRSVCWRLDMDALRADHPAPLHIRYMAEITDESKLPSLFKRAVALRLAANLALRWTSSTRARYLANEADSALKIAMRADRSAASTQRYDGRARCSDWVEGALR